MVSLKIKLNSIEDTKNFSNIASHYPYDMDIVSGRYVIDAKSIMGIFSLDLSKELELVVHHDDIEELKNGFASFLV